MITTVYTYHADKPWRVRRSVTPAHLPEARGTIAQVIRSLERDGQRPERLDKGKHVLLMLADYMAFATVVADKGKIGYVSSLYVPPNSRRMGAARLLLDCAEEVVRDRGGRPVIETYVLATNAPALNLMFSCKYVAVPKMRLSSIERAIGPNFVRFRKDF